MPETDAAERRHSRGDGESRTGRSRSVRRIGPGVGDHASPVSSSRTNSASPVGSVTGSFQNGVRRFSRLLSAHVNAEPDADTIVPNAGFAMTLTHGSGVSRSPSRTIDVVPAVGREAADAVEQAQRRRLELRRLVA